MLRLFGACADSLAIAAFVISAALSLACPAYGTTFASYSASNISPAPDPTTRGWTASTDFLFTTGTFAGQTRPPEEGTTLGPSVGPRLSWEILDVADDGNDADGMKSASEFYYRGIGDQSAVDWTLSFETAVLSNGAANPNEFKPNQGSIATNAFQYQLPYVNSGLRIKFWRVELAATDNGNGTFDLWALGREVAGGPPNFVRGKHALLLNDVSEATAHAMYSYELRYTASLGTASLFFDSGTGLTATAAANFVGDSSGIPHDIESIDDKVVTFGTLTDSGAGHLQVRSVAFSVGEPGDFTGDGVVDGSDFLAWQRGAPGADEDGDGVVGPNDLAIWRQHFGAGGSSVILGQVVPEPSAWALVMPGLYLAAAAFRRRR